jgi:hypothetical protein
MPSDKRIKIIIDTNLFISFLIGKRLHTLKQTLVNSQIQLIFSKQNLLELRIVSKRPKFEKHFSENDVSDLIDLIQSIGKVVQVTKEPLICRDPKDNFLLGLAEMGKANYLVSGDKDLLDLKMYKKTIIISMEELERLLKIITMNK